MREYPEHDKLRAVNDQSQAIGEFLDLFLPKVGIVLMERDKYGDYHPTYRTIQSLLAEYFEIDLDKIEAEKRQMLEDLRALNS